MLDKEFLLELRRRAYVECTQNYLETNTIVGIFGDEMPQELFYACGVLPIPMEGVDSHIFQFGKEEEWEGVCDVVKSTLIYLTTQKCPILYSCKMYVLEPHCQAMIDAIKRKSEKPILVYTNERSLIDALCKVYGTSYNEKMRVEAKKELDHIQKILQKIVLHSNLSVEMLFLLEFYSKYMIDLEERRAYFEELEKELSFTTKARDVKDVNVLCPRGNYSNVCMSIEKEQCKGDVKKNVRIKRVWECGEYGYPNCPFDAKKRIGY